MSANSSSPDHMADAKAHILGAHACFHGAMDALNHANARAALIEIDKVIAIATEARKILLGQAEEL